MMTWSHMQYEELVLKIVLLMQQKRRKNAVIINSTKQITILNKVKKIALACTFIKLYLMLYNVQMTLYIKFFLQRRNLKCPLQLSV